MPPYKRKHGERDRDGGSARTPNSGGSGAHEKYDHDQQLAARPSPHRPGELAMAQRIEQNQQRQGQPFQAYGARGDGRGGRRGGRGGYHHNDAGTFAPNGSGPGRPGPQQGRGGTPGANGTPGRTGTPSIAAEPPQTTASPSLRPAVSASVPARSTPTPAPPSTPPALTEPPPPSESPEPYDYNYMTDEIVSDWKVSGKASLVEDAKSAFERNDLDKANVLFQELLRAGLDARLSAIDAGETVGEIVQAIDGDEPDFPLAASTFLDILSVLTDNDASNPRLRALVLASGIAASLMREMLEYPLLQTLGLVRDTFRRVFVRKQTLQLYKQSNYNLLREETEGYSKLITELFTTTSSQHPSYEVVQETFENIKALIGAFDLDAGRVLDVTLDVFANLLVKHYRFFVRLLRQSSWWPANSQHHVPLPPWVEPDYPLWQTSDEDRSRIESESKERDQRFWDRAREIGIDAFFELGDRQASVDELAKAAHADDDADWVKQTNTLPPMGNPVAAQLLGFKLGFYASAARDAQDTLPVNLVYLAALLIKIGFISLRDLYPHLYPADEDMDAAKDKLLQERDAREQAKRPGGGSQNALARAGALADDTLPGSLPSAGPTAGLPSRLRETTALNSRAATPAAGVQPAKSSGAATPQPQSQAEVTTEADDTKQQLPEPADQKGELLRSLLCIGALPEALYMLGRFPWLIDGHADIAEHIHRILHHCLSKVYEPICPLADRSGLRQAARPVALDQSGLPKGDIRLLEPLPQKVLQWAKMDRRDIEGIDYAFYWHDWADQIPVCQSVDDVLTLCNTLVNIAGHKIGLDASLMMKLTRIGKHSLATDESPKNKSRWIDLCKRLLVPALSLTGCNPGVVNEMYDLLKVFDTPTRYAIYTEWYTGQTSRVHDIESAFAQARAEARDVLKRISKTNTRSMARQLAKVSCASPGIVFQTVLNQIESYSNLIDVVVECGRYFTYMGYDVLTWTLLTTLGKAGRSRVSRETGLTTSLWLLSLSQFAGKIFRRYSTMTPLPILQYVLAQLKLNNFVDLQVLRELCINMGGIAPDTDFTDSQVQAMAGGELLQAQTLKQVHDTRHESKLPARRLIKTLLDGQVAGAMLISIAQQRQMCVFNSDQNQVKAVGENFDGVQIILIQYLDLLRHNLTVEEFDSHVPGIVSLIADYGIEPSIAFTVHRRSIVAAMEAYDAANAPNKPSADVAMSNDVNSGSAKGGSGPEQSLVEAAEAAEAEAKADAEAETVNPEDNKTAGEDTIMAIEDPAVPSSDWHPILADLMANLKPALPDDFESSMSIPFFVSFWQLSINDLMLPTQSYTEEDARQKERIAAINADRSDTTITGMRRKETEKTKIREFLTGLSEEMKGRITRHKNIRARLEREKDHWFTPFQGKSMALSSALLQDCFLPRSIMSPLDAFFAWRMLNMLHSSGTPGFRTMHFIDLLMREKTLANLIFGCTGREAENFGRFLSEVLREMSSWHADKTEYEKRAYGAKRSLPGFVQKYVDGAPHLLSFEDFQRLLYKWHSSLLRASRFCLDSGEYMHIKNAIAILRAVSKYFPVVNWMGSLICSSLEPYLDKQKETRDDVRVLSNSLFGVLKSKQKQWLTPQHFRPGGEDDKAKKAGAPSAVPAASAVVTAPTSKNAKPTPSLDANPKTNGEATKALPNGKIEVEDGEVDDASESAGPKPKPAPAEVAKPLAEKTSAQSVDEIRAKVMASRRRQSQPDSTAARPSTNAQAESSSSVTPARPEATATPNLPPRPETHREQSAAKIPQRPPPVAALPESQNSSRTSDLTNGRRDSADPGGRDGRAVGRVDRIDAPSGPSSQSTSRQEPTTYPQRAAPLPQSESGRATPISQSSTAVRDRRQPQTADRDDWRPAGRDLITENAPNGPRGATAHNLRHTSAPTRPDIAMQPPLTRGRLGSDRYADEFAPRTGLRSRQDESYGRLNQDSDSRTPPKSPASNRAQDTSRRLDRTTAAQPDRDRPFRSQQGSGRSTPNADLDASPGEASTVIHPTRLRLVESSGPPSADAPSGPRSAVVGANSGLDAGRDMRGTAGPQRAGPARPPSASFDQGTSIRGRASAQASGQIGLQMESDRRRPIDTGGDGTDAYGPPRRPMLDTRTSAGSQSLMQPPSRPAPTSSVARDETPRSGRDDRELGYSSSTRDPRERERSDRLDRQERSLRDPRDDRQFHVVGSASRGGPESVPESRHGSSRDRDRESVSSRDVERDRERDRTDRHRVRSDVIERDDRDRSREEVGRERERDRATRPSTRDIEANASGSRDRDRDRDRDARDYPRDFGRERERDRDQTHDQGYDREPMQSRDRDIGGGSGSGRGLRPTDTRSLRSSSATLPPMVPSMQQRQQPPPPMRDSRYNDAYAGRTSSAMPLSGDGQPRKRGWPDGPSAGNYGPGDAGAGGANYGGGYGQSYGEGGSSAGGIKRPRRGQ